MSFLADKLQLQKNSRFFNTLSREFVFFSASTIAYQFSRLAVSLVVARWVGPDEFGVWNTLNLLLLYGILVTLGVPNGMNRDVPLLTGKSNTPKAARITHLSFWFVLGSTAITGLLISVMAINPNISAQFRPSLVWMGGLFLTWQIYLYFQMVLKSHIRFHLMSLQQFIFAFLLPIIVLPLAYVWRVPGFVLGQALVALFLSIIISQKISFKPMLNWDWSELIPLIKIGFPIMAAGLLYSLLTSIDRWVILTFLGTEALGYYTLPILCVSVLNLLPAVVAQQMYPRMALRYGQTQDKRTLGPLIIRQSLAAAVVTLPIIIVTFIFLPLAVNLFMPQYVIGIIPARILLVGLAFLPLAGGVANFLNTVDKQVYYFVVQAGAALINFCIDVVLVKIGWGLNGVALGATITFFIYTFILIGIGSLVYSKNI